MKLISISLMIFTIGLFFKQSNAQWQLSGNFQCETIAHNNSSIFAGSVSGIYVSKNSGTTWTFDSITSSQLQVNKIVVKDSMLFAMVAYDNIYKSPDNGQTWSAVGTAIKYAYTMTLTDSGLVVGTLGSFAGDKASIYHSPDYGNTWNNTLSLTMYDAFVSLISRGSEVWAASSAPSPGIYYSNDGGRTWTLKNNSIYPKDHSLGIAGSNLLCGNYDGLLLSIDSGSTWNQVSSLDFSSFATAPGYTFGGGLGFYYSPDYGYKWVSNSSGLPGTGNIVDINVIDSIVFVTNHSAVYKRNLFELITNINTPLLQSNCFPFPNPFTNELILNRTNNLGTIEVLNLLGDILFKQPASENRTLIFTDNLPAGIYVLRYIEQDNYFNFKVTKSNGQ